MAGSDHPGTGPGRAGTAPATPVIVPTGPAPTGPAATAPAGPARAASLAGARSRSIAAWLRHRAGVTGLPAAYRRWSLVQIAVFGAAMAIFAPMVVTSHQSHFLLNLWLIYSLAGVGFYLVFSLAGRFAFSQTFMMLLGAYTSAYVADHHAYWMAVGASLLVTGATAGLVGFLVRKSQEFYFAIATLALTEIGLIVFSNWTAFSGANGVRENIAPATVFGHAVFGDSEYFWLILVALLVCLVLVSCIERSSFGRQVVAARDLPVVSTTLGIPVAGVQLTMFVLGSMIGGLSGTLYGSWQGFVSTDTFGITLAIGVFLMIVLGGMGSVWGVVIGAAFYVYAPDLLTPLQNYQTIIYGALLVVVIIAFPQGILGGVRRLVGWARGSATATSPSSASMTRHLHELFDRIGPRARG